MVDNFGRQIKPPEKYIIIKNSLLNFISAVNKENMNNNLFIINDACSRVNEIVIHTYQFLRLFVLFGQKINNKFIEITNDVVSMAIKVFIEDTLVGRQVVGTNKIIFEYFTKFYEDEYKSLYDGIKISGTNLSGIFNYIETEIVTSIENNVRVHFMDYLNRYVNCSFKKEHTELLNKITGKEREQLKYKLKAELRLVKDDLLNLTTTRDPKYNVWFNKKYNKILPILDETYDKDHNCYIKTNPQKYLSSMKIMSEEIIEMNYNSFQFFPLRTNIVKKYIPIDTKILIELLIKNGLTKNEYFGNIDKYKDELWSSIFRFNNKMFKQKSRQFDYRILTDGFSVSIQFIHVDFLEKEKATKMRLKKGRENAQIEYKDLERSKIDELKKKRIEKQKNYKKNEIEKGEENKKKFKKLTKEEKENVIKKIKAKIYIEFPYLEELNEDQMEELKNKKILGKVVYVDPGKKNILYMMNEDGVYFRYSNKERIYETKRLEYQNKIEKYKKLNGINEIEQEMCGYNSKACKINEFKKYVICKNYNNSILKDEYEHKIFRKYKWYGHINRKRSEDNLMNKIEKVYGKDIILIYGDWSIGKQMRNFISTPNLGIKRKLATKFKTYSIDEYNSSKINYKSLEKVQNMYLLDRKGVIRKKHSILMYKTENGRQGCINRDKSAVNGMKLITDYFMEHKKRHPSYARKKENKKRDRPNVKRIDESGGNIYAQSK